MFAWYTEVLRKYTVFSGRAGRPEFWWFLLMNVIIYAVLYVLAFSISIFFEVILAIYGLAILLPSIGVTIRRLHDTNRSGWWYLISFIPFVGGIILLILCAGQGTVGDNNYGGPPATEPGASY